MRGMTGVREQKDSSFPAHLVGDTLHLFYGALFGLLVLGNARQEVLHVPGSGGKIL